jgi:AcrR family transcriptional regulator
MPRAGLTTETVVATAAALIDREGRGSLTLARLAADLGVRAPSLYNHVAGISALERLLAIHGVGMLAAECGRALMGRSGGEGLIALARSYRSFAHNHPGLYPLTQVARPDDPEYAAAASQLLGPLLALLEGFDLAGDDRIHAARTLRSALHGFVLLESQSGFGIDVDLDDSFDWMVGSLAGALETSAAGNLTPG